MPDDHLALRREQLAKTLDDALAFHSVLHDHPFKVEDLYDADAHLTLDAPSHAHAHTHAHPHPYPHPHAQSHAQAHTPASPSVPPADVAAARMPRAAYTGSPLFPATAVSLLMSSRQPLCLPSQLQAWLPEMCQAPLLSPPPSLLPPSPPGRIPDFSKPINALGPLCFAGFYLVSLTRTIVRNRTVPRAVRRAFMAPQLRFGFTVHDTREPRWRHIPTVQIPFDSLAAAGRWLKGKLAIASEPCTFKMVKDALQKAVADAWADGTWHMLVDTLNGDFEGVMPADLEDALNCDAVSGRAKGTPPAYFRQLNCHKGAPDIRRDVDGAIGARDSLRWVLDHLGLNRNGCDIPVNVFRDEVFPLWRHQCSYVREHQAEECCQFYDGGYFKKIMIHKHLYSLDGCTSSYHVKDLFEGLDEVIKVRSNPTGMCVREAKCAAGLRYNVDKSFQSGIRSYSKAKFLEAAPHTAHNLLERERQLFSDVRVLLRSKQKRYAKCRRVLLAMEVRNANLSQRQLPEILLPKLLELAGGHLPAPPSPARKRKRQDRDTALCPSTPREQKRKHAHLSLKRKEAAEKRVKQYLELLREDCEKQQSLLDTVRKHGTDCSCLEPDPNDLTSGEYPTSANVPVA